MMLFFKPKFVANADNESERLQLMEHKPDIARRIKDLRKKKKFSQAFVAENLFISQAAYSLIENSQNGIVAEHIIKLSKLYGVTTDYILKGDKMLVKMAASNGFVPLIKKDAHAGFVENFKAEDFLENMEWFKIPGINPSQEQKLFEVEGESMVPTLLPGDIVICQKQMKLDNILDGTVVLLVTSKKILVKRWHLQENPDVFVLESDNPDDNEGQQINKSEVDLVMIVRGKITNVLLPHHNFPSKGKIQAMEEAIEFLKKELFMVTKKLNALSN